MLNLGYKIALAMGVKIETMIESDLSEAVDSDRAALSVSTPTARAALPVGVNLHPQQELLYLCTPTERAGSPHGCKLTPWGEPVLSVGVDKNRAALLSRV